jgi:fucose 4-O-acetylase-like acetyltransferase
MTDRNGARDAWFDNIKAALIFLVVFGHVAQKYIHNRNSRVYIAFVIIYCFHMPLFIFLSGYFSRDRFPGDNSSGDRFSGDAGKTPARAFERFLLPYIVWEFIWFAVSGAAGWNSDFNFAVPWFAYWYFLSLFTLCVLLPVLARIRFVVPALFVLALVSGLYTDYGAAFSLGRTVCFSGFFMLGYFCDRRVLEKIRKNRIPVLAAALVTVLALILLCLTTYVRSRLGKIERSLWMAGSYRSVPIAAAEGLIIRAIIIASAFPLGAFMIAFTPRKKSRLSAIGAHSLTVFVLHGFFIEFLNRRVNLDPASPAGIALIFVISLGVTLLLSAGPLYRAYRRFMGFIAGLVCRGRF